MDVDRAGTAAAPTSRRYVARVRFYVHGAGKGGRAAWPEQSDADAVFADHSATARMRAKADLIVEQAPDVAAVVVARGGEQPFVKIALVDLATGTVKLVPLERTAPAGYAPILGAVCADAEGFTVLWQEQQRGNERFAGSVHATLARVRADGTFLAKPSTVAIPWAIAAIVDDGRLLRSGTDVASLQAPANARAPRATTAADLRGMVRIRSRVAC